MKISKGFVLRLISLLAISEATFEQWFAGGFYDIERVVDITPSEYSAAIMEKAKTLISGTEFISFRDEVNYFAKRL